MKKNNFVEIRKLTAVENPLTRTPNKEEFKPGQDNPGMSLPVEYTVRGTLTSDVELGKPVSMDRTERNGVKFPGFFMTTTVMKIEGDKFYTRNSCYEVKPIANLAAN